MKKCKVEGCNNNVFGKHFCKYHYPKSIPKKSLGSKAKDYVLYGSAKTIDMLNNTFKDEFNRMLRDQFFEMIWKKRYHKSEVSGTPLGNTPNSMFFHHILPKSKYPEAEFDEQNIVLLTPEEHANVETDIYRYEAINILREFLKQKYNIL